jgi:hypothetical protein
VSTTAGRLLAVVVDVTSRQSITWAVTQRRPPTTEKPTQRLRGHLKTNHDEEIDVKTRVDGPRVIVHEDSTELLLDPKPESTDPGMPAFEEDDGEPTKHRGTHPPKPSSSRRLSPTLMKIFQRRREQIGLSLKQVADLSGIALEDLARFEATQGNARLFYDHVVVLARVLGLKPHDLPGMRARDSRDPVKEAIEELERALRGGPRLTFEGQKGERFGGDVDRVVTSPSFGVTIGDSTLEPTFAKGVLLGFLTEFAPKPGEVVLVRHRRSKLLALRRNLPPQLAGLAAWQPAYVGGGEWIAVGQLQIVLPRG